MSSISPHHILVIITHKKEPVEADIEQSTCQAVVTLCVGPAHPVGMPDVLWGYRDVSQLFRLFIYDRLN